MIEYTKGNIIESDADALVNTVNTVGVMGKGLALQFKEAFPVNYAVYREVCRKESLKVGHMLVTDETLMDGTHKTIINFPTKTDWRKPSEYQYIESGLEALRKEIVTRGIRSVAIPPLGSRNGGLDWQIVKGMIETALADLDCRIIIYEPTEVIHEKMKKERASLTPARAMLLYVMDDMVKHGEFTSEFAAEKIAYFLQRFGAQEVFKLTFERGVYGPYSGKVRYVLRYMNGSYIMGMSDLSKRPFEEIWMVDDAAEEAKKFLNHKENHGYLEIAEDTKCFLSDYYSNFSLELLATIDFIMQTDHRLINLSALERDEVYTIVSNDIAEWNNRKQRLFMESKYIDKVLDYLYRTLYV